jgi:hypothetical protein
MKQAFLRVVAAAVLVLAGSSIAWAQSSSITVNPASPRYMEPVYLVGTLRSQSQFLITSRTSMQGSTVVVDYVWGIEIPSNSTRETLLGRFPTGTYTVQANLPTGTLMTTFTVGPNPVDVLSGGPHVPTADYTGLWWNPAESGWGIYIMQGVTNKIFAAWLTYDAAGNPTWFTLQPGTWESGAYRFTGPIYRTTGPYFGGPFGMAQVTEVQVGTGTLEFQDHATGRFAFTINGQSIVKTIQKLPVE